MDLSLSKLRETGESGELPSTGSQRVGHALATEQPRRLTEPLREVFSQKAHISSF